MRTLATFTVEYPIRGARSPLLLVDAHNKREALRLAAPIVSARMGWHVPASHLKTHNKPGTGA